MAEEPNAFSALAIGPANPTPFPGPMFHGLNAIINPFKSPPSSPLRSQHHASTAAAGGSGPSKQPAPALTAQAGETQAAGTPKLPKPAFAAPASTAPAQTAPEGTIPPSENQKMPTAVKAAAAGSSVLANQTSGVSPTLPAVPTLPAAAAQPTLASSSLPAPAPAPAPSDNNSRNLLSSAPTSTSSVAAAVPTQAVQRVSKPAQAVTATTAAPSAALPAVAAAAAVPAPSATQAELQTPAAATQQTSQPELQSSQPPVLPGPANLQSASAPIAHVPAAAATPPAPVVAAVPTKAPAAAAVPAAAAPVAAAVLTNAPAATAGNKRPASKRNWDVMTQPEPAAAPEVGTAVAAAATFLPPAVGQTTSATQQLGPEPSTSDTKQRATPAAAGAVQMPIPAPPQVAQSTTAASQAGMLQSLQSGSALEAAKLAASKALAGKELAAKLAADFAQQHRSKQSTAPSVAALPTHLPTHLPAPMDLSAAVKAAAAAAAEKVLGSEAARAKAAAEKLIHEQALKAKQSVQSSGDTHTARMEALRLRNAARKDSPQALAVLPIAMPEPQLAAKVALPPKHSELQDLEQSQGGSRPNKKRGRESQQGAVWDLDTAENLPGPPAVFAAKGDKGRGRTDSPASAGSRDSYRQRRGSADSLQV